MGDFIGFTLGGIHSSQYNLYRVSDGSRYNENLLPTLQDKTVQVPGGDGTYYFGSYYTTRTFDLKLAYNQLNESQFRDLRQWLGKKELRELVFDEEPYKSYYVKCSSIPQLQYICFDENGGRVYKGEGSVQFTAYYPFAICKYKSLQDYIELNQVTLESVSDWANASGLPTQKYSYIWDRAISNDKRSHLKNCGDLPMDIEIAFDYNQPVDIHLTPYATGVKDSDPCIQLDAIGELKPGDNNVIINSKTHLIEGVYDTYVDNDPNVVATRTKTGNIYNEYITGGDFFKIPQGDWDLCSPEFIAVRYNYLYF